MNPIASLYQCRLAVVDLDAGCAHAAPLCPDILESGLGGGALASALAPLYPNATFLTSGPLGGGYAPASGAMTVSIPHSDNRGFSHAVAPLGHGAWLRQSGFDALVICGRSASPRVIRCTGGDCCLEDAPVGMADRATLRAHLLRQTEDGRAGLILADSGNANLPVAGGAEYGSLPAGTLIGPALQARNISGLCLEGGSPLPLGQLPLDNALRQAVARHTPDNALANFFTEAQCDAALVAGFKLKGAACFHCPSPCLCWIETSESTHLLLADHGAFAAALDACGSNAPACLAACDAVGVDPRVAAPLVKNSGAEEFSRILASLACTDDSPPQPASELSEAERIASILGICPRLVRRTPGLSREVLEAALGSEASTLLARSEAALGQEVFV